MAKEKGENKTARQLLIAKESAYNVYVALILFCVLYHSSELYERRRRRRRRRESQHQLHLCCAIES